MAADNPGARQPRRSANRKNARSAAAWFRWLMREQPPAAPFALTCRSMSATVMSSTVRFPWQNWPRNWSARAH